MPSKKLAALAAISLAFGSSAAIAQSAQPLSPSNSPTAAGAPIDEASELRGGGIGLYVIGAIALGLIIWGIIELLGDDDDGPTSP